LSRRLTFIGSGATISTLEQHRNCGAVLTIKEIFMTRYTFALLAGVSLLAISSPAAWARTVSEPSIGAVGQHLDRIQLAEGEGCYECGGGDDGDGGDDGEDDDAPGNSGENAHGANDNVGLNAGGGNGAEGGDPGNSEDHNNGAVSGTHAQSDAALGETDSEDAHVR
jgi:hypothetical protein